MRNGSRNDFLTSRSQQRIKIVSSGVSSPSGETVSFRSLSLGAKRETKRCPLRWRASSALHSPVAAAACDLCPCRRNNSHVGLAPSFCICMFSCDFSVSSQKRFPELKEARQAWDERLPGAQWDDQTRVG